MDSLTALQTRVSCGLLDEPGPTPEQLEQLLRAGLRAPDHGNLQPWQFILIEGDARHRFGELMVQGMGQLEPKDAERIRKKPLRAPTILVVVAKIVDSPKIPKIEQILAAGAAATNIVNAAFAMGIGAMWRTGSITYNPLVKSSFGLDEDDEIAGFIYLGTPKVRLKPVPERNPKDFLVRW